MRSWRVRAPATRLSPRRGDVPAPAAASPDPLDRRGPRESRPRRRDCSEQNTSPCAGPTRPEPPAPPFYFPLRHGRYMWRRGSCRFGKEISAAVRRREERLSIRQHVPTIPRGEDRSTTRSIRLRGCLQPRSGSRPNCGLCNDRATRDGVAGKTFSRWSETHPTCPVARCSQGGLVKSCA